MPSKASERSGPPRSAFAIASLCAWLLGCADVSNDPVAAAGTGGEAPATSGTNAGEGGETVSAAGGASGANDASAGEAGSSEPPPVRNCESDADCDATSFCAGAELCVEIDASTGIGHCHAAPVPPCWPEDCDEANRTCDCSDDALLDHDNDGAVVPYCASARNAPEDCDDNDGERHPGEPEVCDAAHRDEDCDDTTYYERDEDGDNHPDAQCSNFSLRAGAYLGGDDCDDEDPEINPDADETCDTKDNDCDGLFDEVFGIPNADINYYYLDVDGDGWGDSDERLETQCDHSPFPETYKPDGGDCDDNDFNVNLGREELCNGIDDNCDPGRQIDELPLTEKPPYPETSFECGEGAWQVISCPPDLLDCGPRLGEDGCETPATTLCNCHECDNRCAFSCGESACEEIVSMSMGYEHTCAIAAPGENGVPSGPGRAVCWGRNQSGQIGADPAVIMESGVPRAVALSDVKVIAAGREHNCAIAGEQNGVFCWGSNDYGQLGASGEAPEYFTPVPVYRAVESVEFVALATGEHHSCAVASNGALYCWGRGGRLGNGNSLDNPIPTRVRRRPELEELFVDNARSVVAGYEHSCLVATTGEVECWGENDHGQLGDGLATENSLIAQRIAGLTLVDSLCAGVYHTCALSGGQVYCWGDNREHQLGLEGNGAGLPALVPGISDATSISCGATFTCALNQARELRCWGSNHFGETGQSGTDSSPTPAVITFADEPLTVFGGGGDHACALTSSAQAWCWGQNRFGQLGVGSVDPEAHAVPTRLLGLNGASSCIDP